MLTFAVNEMTWVQYFTEPAFKLTKTCCAIYPAGPTKQQP